MRKFFYLVLFILLSSFLFCGCDDTSVADSVAPSSSLEDIRDQLLEKAAENMQIKM